MSSLYSPDCGVRRANSACSPGCRRGAPDRANYARPPTRAWPWSPTIDRGRKAGSPGVFTQGCEHRGYQRAGAAAVNPRDFSIIACRLSPRLRLKGWKGSRRRFLRRALPLDLNPLDWLWGLGSAIGPCIGRLGIGRLRIGRLGILVGRLRHGLSYRLASANRLGDAPRWRRARCFGYRPCRLALVRFFRLRGRLLIRRRGIDSRRLLGWRRGRRGSGRLLVRYRCLLPSRRDGFRRRIELLGGGRKARRLALVLRGGLLNAGISGERRIGSRLFRRGTWRATWRGTWFATWRGTWRGTWRDKNHRNGNEPRGILAG